MLLLLLLCHHANNATATITAIAQLALEAHRSSAGPGSSSSPRSLCSKHLWP